MVVERKKQIIETREDNYKLLNINNFKSSSGLVLSAYGTGG